MDAKHTPGPWRFTNDDGVEVPFTYRSKGYYDNPQIIGANGETVVGCGEYYIFSGPEDARLIAAAPDLLAACKAALEKGDDYVSMNMLKDAIAKAEGRA